jgi:hypothetical protein
MSAAEEARLEELREKVVAASSWERLQLAVELLAAEIAADREVRQAQHDELVAAILGANGYRGFREQEAGNPLNAVVERLTGGGA